MLSKKCDFERHDMSGNPNDSENRRLGLGICYALLGSRLKKVECATIRFKPLTTPALPSLMPLSNSVFNPL